MVNVYSASNMMSPLKMNYGYNPQSKGVALYRFADTEIVGSGSPQAGFSQSFVQAIYGDGPYSLLCPNETTEFVGRRFDALA